jgi:hypothetical protein
MPFYLFNTYSYAIFINTKHILCMYQYLYHIWVGFVQCQVTRGRPSLTVSPRLNPKSRAAPLPPLEGAPARALEGAAVAHWRAPPLAGHEPILWRWPTTLTLAVDLVRRSTPPTRATGVCSPMEQLRAPLLTHLSSSSMKGTSECPYGWGPISLSNLNLSVQFHFPWFYIVFPWFVGSNWQIHLV